MVDANFGMLSVHTVLVCLSKAERLGGDVQYVALPSTAYASIGMFHNPLRGTYPTFLGRVGGNVRTQPV